jgi:4-carboxymuconolactone decarboxylase
MQTTAQGWFGVLGFVAMVAVASPAQAATMHSRTAGCEQQTLIHVFERPARSPLDAVRRDCPLLGRIIEKFAMQDLGEEPPVEIATPHPSEIAVVAASAASGDVVEVRRFTQVALANGAQPVELEEMLYLTAVNVGIPKAIDATRAIADLIALSAANGCVEASNQF